MNVKSVRAWRGWAITCCKCKHQKPICILFKKPNPKNMALHERILEVEIRPILKKGKKR